jgi:hypothetical protein
MNLLLWLVHWRTLGLGDWFSTSHSMYAQSTRELLIPRFDLYRNVPSYQSIKVKKQATDLGRVAKIFLKNLRRLRAEVFHDGLTNIPREQQQPMSTSLSYGPTTSSLGNSGTSTNTPSGSDSRRVRI